MLPRDYLEFQARYYPKKVAYMDRDRSLTWREIYHRSMCLARQLSERGLKKGDIVAMIGLDHIEKIESFFACLISGMVQVRVNWRYSAAQMAAVIRDCDARAILVEKDLMQRVENSAKEWMSEGRLLIGIGTGHELPLDYESLIERTEPGFESPPLEDDDVAFLTYTSGTTSLPKGAVLTHGNLRDAWIYTSLTYGFRHEDVWMNMAAVDGIAIVCATMNAVSGMTSVLYGEKFDPGRFLRIVEESKVTAALVVPTMLQRIVEEKQRNSYHTESLRLLTFGSSPATPSLIRSAFETFQCDISHVYGATETTWGILSYFHPTELMRALEEAPDLLKSCGRPTIHTQVTVRDDEGQILPVGEIGEVCVRSSTVMKGYLNRSVETQEAFFGDWYRTGDMGYFDGDGHLYLVDRKRFKINTGAFKVYPTAVEAVIAEHPAVREVAVFGVPHPEWGEAVVAVVSTYEGKRVSGEEILGFCRTRLSQWEVPKFIDFLDDLPKGFTDKINKKALQEWYVQQSERLPWRSGH